MYGVEPGGLAAGGKTPGEAYSDFRRTLRSVLYDIAAEVNTFDEFRLQVQEFFRDKNGPAEADWNQAVKDVRSGAVREDGISVGNNPIKRLPADTKRSVSVKLLEAVTATPKDNKVDPPLAVAA
jgi:hypothetical protein